MTAPRSDAAYKKAIEMLSNDIPLKIVSKECGISSSRIKVKLNAMGTNATTLRGGTRAKKHTGGKFLGIHSKEYIAELVYEYKKWSGVAKHLGVNTNIIRIWACKNNIYLREITGKTRTDKVNADVKNKQYSTPYKAYTLKDLAIRRPWFGGALCL